MFPSQNNHLIKIVILSIFDFVKNECLELKNFKLVSYLVI